MSATAESATPTVEHRSHRRIPVEDIFLWRRKNLSTIVLLVATATWVALEVYQYNFITVASWAAMFVVALAFAWGNIHRLLRKEVPDLSGMEMSDKSAIEMADTIREWVNEFVRWIFRVAAERELFVFATTVAGLCLLSLISSRLDLLTLSFFGIVLGMTAPVVYIKYEHKIKEYQWRLRMQSQTYYGVIEERVKKMKSRLQGKKKEKKTE